MDWKDVILAEMKKREVIEYLKENGLLKKSRKRSIVDVRCYAAKYMKMNNISFTDIGLSFGQHHTTIMHLLKRYENAKTQFDFVDHCKDIIGRFPIQTEQEYIKSTIQRNKSILVTLSDSQYEQLQDFRVENIIYTNEEAIKRLITNNNK
tara:strand:+ start:5723 stop:6172 length:450 start_codon:yes stop_codon:yes gene_type:complete